MPTIAINPNLHVHNGPVGIEIGRNMAIEVLNETAFDIDIQRVMMLGKHLYNNLHIHPASNWQWYLLITTPWLNCTKTGWV